MFIGDAKRQAQEILDYVSAIGDVALVDSRTRVAELVAGTLEDDHIEVVAGSVSRGENAITMPDERTVVGLVGVSHVLVLCLRKPVAARAAAIDRVARACALLNRMLNYAPLGGPPGSGSAPGGAPAPAEATLPPRRTSPRRAS